MLSRGVYLIILSVSSPPTTVGQVPSPRIPPSCAFHTATERLVATFQSTTHPCESPLRRRRFERRNLRAWIGEVCPRRMKIGVAGVEARGESMGLRWAFVLHLYTTSLSTV